MNTRPLIIVFIAVSLMFDFFYALCQQKGLPVGKVCANDRCFSVEIASAQMERETGLMFREKMDADKGMLFVYDQEGQYAFWMKNTLLPLDMIWIDKDKKIVSIAKNVQPCKNDPCEVTDPSINATYVLELNAGISEEIGLKSGDEVKFYLPRPGE